MVDRRSDGSLCTIETTITPVPDEGGRISHYVAIMQDVTLRKQTEEALQEASQAAEAANRAKSEFLANMSHEIRTPMNAILGFAEQMLDADQDPAERRDAADTIRRNGKHLVKIINDILDISKIEAGKIAVEHMPCSPWQLVAEVKSLMQIRADDKELEFSVEHRGALPKLIHTDPTRLRQILVNLIDNAIKFTPSGSVRLIVKFVDGQEPVMQFHVVDTGIGMTPQQAENIFLAFVQADNSMARKFGGTGLGLTLSKRLAEMLGGGIVVADSQVDVGSRFLLTVATGPLEGVEMLDDPGLPTMAGTDKPETLTPPEERLGCRILLAEDGFDNQRIISLLLKKAGAEVTIAENGRLAVDAILAARDEGMPFDVVLMDMQMPVMGGYEATSLLRHDGYSGAIVALTAHAMADDRQKCLDAGCDDYMSKPIDRAELLRMVSKYADARLDASR